jgi:hypothetical protein
LSCLLNATALVLCSGIGTDACHPDQWQGKNLWYHLHRSENLCMLLAGGLQRRSSVSGF